MQTRTAQPQATKPQPAKKAESRKLQRKCGCDGAQSSCDGCAKKKVQRHARGPERPDAIPAEVDATLASSGTPLDPASRTFMESRFGHDFSRVRIHTGGTAALSADAVDARAYTVGQHVVFGAGAYRPNTDAGRRLLAHELTHVVQQSSGAALQMSSDISTPGDASEVEADRAADTVMRGGTPRIGAAPAAPLQRAALRHCTTPNARACVIHLHTNENNAYLASQQIQREYCVNYVSLGGGGGRTITVPGVSRPINPNRIYSDDPAILRWHAFGEQNPRVPTRVTAADITGLRTWRDTVLRPAIMSCGAGTGTGWNASLPMVAMHNNTEGALSAGTYTPDGGARSPWTGLDDTQVAHRTVDPSTVTAAAPNPSRLTAATAPVPGREDPDNFLLATPSVPNLPGLRSRFNTVVQPTDVGNQTNPAFDASLAAAMATSQYINIEAQEKEFSGARYAFNLEMARDVMTHLGIPRRPAAAGTCEDGISTVSGAAVCPPPPPAQPAAQPAAQPGAQTGTQPAAPAQAPAAPTPTPATPPPRARPANLPANCPYYSSRSMLVDAKEEWRRHIDGALLGTTGTGAGHVTPAGARWIIGTGGSSFLSPNPATEATAAQSCMINTMRATQRAGGTAGGPGTPLLHLEPVVLGRMHRSYTQQRDEIWNRKWNFTGSPFDRITQAAHDFVPPTPVGGTAPTPVCNALTVGGQWTPGNATHLACWNSLPDDLKAQQILQASAAPGVSRHHWGTDFDFQELNATPWSSGAWTDEALWLSINAKFFGFIQSFSAPPPAGQTGYMPEPWHWSYWPVAQALVEFTLAHDADIETALVGQWATEGTVAAGARVPSHYTYALDHWRQFVRNVQTAAPAF